MFGGRRGRVEKLSAGAAKNLEPGESIRELVQTQTGQSAARNARAVMSSELVSAGTGAAYRSKVNAAPHVLVATDRNLYAMRLSGARLVNVGEVVLKVPLEEADLRRDKDRLIVDNLTFHVMALFGQHAERLAEYVGESRTSAAS